MKVFVLVLGRLDRLEPLLERFSRDGISGATILSSSGMVRTLSEGAGSFLGSLRMALNPGGVENRTVFTVVSDEQVAVALKAVDDIVGDLSKPDTGIVFTLPVDFTKGVQFPNPTQP